jgi:hypothetical protein
MLLEIAHAHYPGTRLAEELDRRIEAAFGAVAPEGKAPSPPDSKAVAELSAWARQEVGVETTAAELQVMGRAEARSRLVDAIDARHRPEMREMEKVLVLQILDSSWMEHLRAMDHLRSSIGLQSYAQIDPKVEYKREGMKIFAEMWNGVSDKVTDLVFRVEQFDPEFLSYLGARWQLDRAQTIHESPTPSPRPRRPGRGSASSRTRPSPRASSRPRRSASRSATWEEKWAAMTRVPAGRVKSSRPAACARRPPSIRSDSGRTLHPARVSSALVLGAIDRAGAVLAFQVRDVGHAGCIGCVAFVASLEGP